MVFIGMLAAFAAAIAAVFTDAWRPSHKGFAKLSIQGWVLALAAVVSLVVSYH